MTANRSQDQEFKSIDRSFYRSITEIFDSTVIIPALGLQLMEARGYVNPRRNTALPYLFLIEFFLVASFGAEWFNLNSPIVKLTRPFIVGPRYIF